jgi:hypothetical protein
MLLILLNYLIGVAVSTRDLVLIGRAGLGVVRTQMDMQREDALLCHVTVLRSY